MAITRRKALSALLGLSGLALRLRWPGRPAEAGLLLPLTPACDDGDADPTESVVEGPFYVPNTPRRTVLREAGTVGTPLLLQGRC